MYLIFSKLHIRILVVTFDGEKGNVGNDETMIPEETDWLHFCGLLPTTERIILASTYRLIQNSLNVSRRIRIIVCITGRDIFNITLSLSYYFYPRP